MMHLRSTPSQTVMEADAVMKNLSILHRKIGSCLRPNRSVAQGPSYCEIISQNILETDAFVASSVKWENIFGVAFPTKEGEM